MVADHVATAKKPHFVIHVGYKRELNIHRRLEISNHKIIVRLFNYSLKIGLFLYILRTKTKYYILYMINCSKKKFLIKFEALFDYSFI